MHAKRGIRVGSKISRLPIIQGGMAIRISTGLLAGTVAKHGGIGVIGASGMRFDELGEEIKQAKAIAGKEGIVGINIMYAAKEFWGIVKTAVEHDIDLIITGAGISRDIYRYGKETGTPIFPLASSARLARAVEKLGAEAVIVEGKEAGGHLGTDRSVLDLVPEVRAAVKIPVLAAGGIVTGRDIADQLVRGADGVQMATRFVPTHECNADRKFKERYFTVKGPEDLGVAPTSTGFPGSMILTEYARALLSHTAPLPTTCDQCLKLCTYEICTYEALERARMGDVENGIVFAGQSVLRLPEKRIVSTEAVIQDLVQGIENASESELKAEIDHLQEQKEQAAEQQEAPSASARAKSTRYSTYNLKELRKRWAKEKASPTPN